MDVQLSDNALTVLRARYLRRDADGELAETPEELFRRVASTVAAGSGSAAGEWEARYLQALSRLEFLPNSPLLMNAGTPLGQLSACFVLPVADSLDDIFESLKLMALVQQSGGGTGFAFSHLRPRADIVTTTGGASSGPVAFMRVFDRATESIRQGGRRRGANMGILRVDHPDIEEFIDAKRDVGEFENFNLSVAVDDAFMEAAARGDPIELRNPRTGNAVRSVPAAQLFGRITEAAWRTGDPGLVFLDAIHRANPTPQLGRIEATNPCGEVPLLPYESCNLASVNLAKMVTETGGVEAGGVAVLDRARLAATTELLVRFLDDALEVGRWPAPPITEATLASRKIGIGVMGFAELLIRLGIPYGSERAVRQAGEVMALIREHADAASERLAAERGAFPNWAQSVYAEQGRVLRHATRTSIAPTGTIGIIADTTPGIEPLFALAFRRENVLGGETLEELNPLFLSHARERGFYSESLVRELVAHGSLRGVSGIPADVRELWATALEIEPEQHLRIQRAFQEHVDNAVSKTVNLPGDATIEDVARIYRQAWEWGLKGTTVYRYGSKGEQVLRLGVDESPADVEHFKRCDPDSCKS